MRAISAVAASSIMPWMGMQPLPPSQASVYVSPTLMLVRSPASVRGPCAQPTPSHMNRLEPRSRNVV